MERVSDKSLLQKINQRLSRLGGSQVRITASANGGDVTLSGTLQYEMQRSPAVRAATSVAGVRRVIDQLRVIKKPKHQ